MGWLYSNQWAAGFFDGEGCASIRRRIRKNAVIHRLWIQITQKNRESLDRLRKRFGGSVGETKTPGNCFRWRATGRKAEAFLRAIYPHVLVKRRVVKLALAFRATKGTVGVPVGLTVIRKRNKICDQISQLNTPKGGRG